jgi:hypothetical protein
MLLARLALQLWRWKWYVPPKRRHPYRLRDVTAQNIVFCTSTYLPEKSVSYYSFCFVFLLGECVSVKLSMQKAVLHL